MRFETLQEVLSLWQARLEADNRLREYIGSPFRLVVREATNQTQSNEWLITPGPPVVIRKGTCQAGVTVSMKEADVLALANGELNPQQLFLNGGLVVSGNTEQALRLHRLMVCQ